MSGRAKNLVFVTISRKAKVFFVKLH